MHPRHFGAGGDPPCPSTGQNPPFVIATAGGQVGGSGRKGKTTRSRRVAGATGRRFSLFWHRRRAKFSPSGALSDKYRPGRGALRLLLPSPSAHTHAAAPSFTIAILHPSRLPRSISPPQTHPQTYEDQSSQPERACQLEDSGLMMCLDGKPASDCGRSDRSTSGPLHLVQHHRPTPRPSPS